ncbi:MAG: hypothetical protein IT518_12780 [Burkholderiales bacterium]|nr:hypothetical protein [Burkholderiales bacterium]
MQPRPDEVAQAANAGLSSEGRARRDFYASANYYARIAAFAEVYLLLEREALALALG